MGEPLAVRWPQPLLVAGTAPLLAGVSAHTPCFFLPRCFIRIWWRSTDRVSTIIVETVGLTSVHLSMSLFINVACHIGSVRLQ